MRAIWAILLGAAAGVGLAVWLAGHEKPAPVGAAAGKHRSGGEQSEDALPGLYRWRDDQGVLHVSDAPPKGVRAERVARAPRTGIEVHGDR